LVAEELDFDLGTPGASGRREHERRRANRESRVRERHPRIGNLLLKFQEAPRHERAWATGADGEEEMAESLARRCPQTIVLHDRRLPGTRANIDHLAVAPSGVYVIDAKRYKGKVEVRKPFFGEPKLMIRGRDRTKLARGLSRQVDAVRKAIGAAAPPVDVHGCLCFVGGDAEMPLLRKLSFDGYPLLYPKRLARWLNRPGELGTEEMRALAETLARALPPA
jgi:hypothetical protein